LFSKNDSLAQRQKMSEWASPVSIRCSSLWLCLSDHTQASIGWVS
jgi:hypothetical protein